LVYLHIRRSENFEDNFLFIELFSKLVEFCDESEGSVFGRELGVFRICSDDCFLLKNKNEVLRFCGDKWFIKISVSFNKICIRNAGRSVLFYK